jgi:predicted small lipoprotein YifL
MIAPIRFLCLAALGLALAGCASKPVSEMPAAATTAATESAAAAEEKDDVTPMDRAQANAECWMKYDKSGGTLEAKAKLVEKCSDDKIRGR